MSCQIINHDIPRDLFVKRIFEIGSQYNHAYDTGIIAVNVGDAYVMRTQTSYSEELLYTVLVLAAKLNEDAGYRSIGQANIELENNFAHALEWHIFHTLDCHIPRNTYIDDLNKFMSVLYPGSWMLQLGTVFKYLSQDICCEPTLLEARSVSIMCASILLRKKGKLKATQEAKEQKFLTIMSTTAREWEFTLSQLLRAYIEHKRHK
jgi:hypothetical protein